MLLDSTPLPEPSLQLRVIVVEPLSFLPFGLKETVGFCLSILILKLSVLVLPALSVQVALTVPVPNELLLTLVVK